MTSEPAPSGQPRRRRAIALVGALNGERRAAHTEGFPLDPEQMLPEPDVVLMVVDDVDRNVMLFRYTAHGQFGGDTLHGTIGEAVDQATFEYGEALGTWIEVPSEVTDAHAFAVRYAYDHLNKRGDW